MKNFKQVLALVVVFTLMISSVAMAAVPADVVGTDYEEAAIRLGALGIMVGDEAGFRPEDSVKRSEMAKITVIMVGSDAAAKAAAGNTVFSDVAADHWASGYVNVASSLGLVIGNGDGTFAPDAEVTNAQAITMIMRALNYESYAADNGGYPTGFVVAATNAEVLEGVDDIDLNKAATRGVIAQMVNNALEAPMMVQTTYGNGSKEYVISGQNNVAEATILVDKLKLKKYTGTVSKIDTEKGRVTITGAEAAKDGDAKLPSEIKYSSALTLGSELKELEINLWVDKDNVMICYGMPEETDIIYGYIESVNDYTESQMNSKKYSFSGAVGEEIESIELSNGVSYSFTAEDVDDLEVYTFADGYEPKFTGADANYKDLDLADAKSAVNVKMPIKAAVQDGKIVKLGFFDYTDLVGIVSEASETAVRATENGLKNGGSKKSFTKLDEAESVLVIKDGVAGASLTDIAAGMYVIGTSWTESGADEASYIILVADNSLTGKFSKKGSSSLTVAGETVRLASATIPVSIDGGATFTKESLDKGDNLTSLLQSEITVVNNLAGDAVAIIGTSTASRTAYGLVDRVYQSSGEWTVTLFVVEDGAVVKKNYLVSDKFDVAVGDDVEKYSRKTLAGNKTMTEDEKLQALAENGYYKVTLNSDNEIKDMEKLAGAYVVGSDDNKDASVVYNILNGSVSYTDAESTKAVAMIQSSTKFFDIKDCFDANVAAPTLIDVAALVGKDLSDQFGMALVTDGTTLLAGILTNGTSGLTADDVKFGLVTEVATTGDEVLTVTMITSEGTVVKDVDADEVDTKTVKKGAVVAYEDYSETSMNIRGVGDRTATTLTGFAGLSGSSKKIDFQEVTIEITNDVIKALEDYDYEVLPVEDGLFAEASNAVVLEYNDNTEKYVVRDLSALDAGDNAYIVVNNYDTQYVMIVID